MSIIQVPLNIVGSTVFGRYPKISNEQTWNMIISDSWLVPFAGNRMVLSIEEQGQGRGLYNSQILGKFIAVINESVYLVDANLSFLKIGTLDSSTGIVQIDENNGKQIIINDNRFNYIYDYNSNTFSKVTFPIASPDAFTPKGATFQKGLFVSGVSGSASWRLSDFNNGSSGHWIASADKVGEFQDRADTVQIIKPIPGKGNLLMVMGNITSQLWSFTGAQLFPYQLNSGVSIDYGCINPDTVDASDEFIVWLGINRKSGLAILYSDAGNVRQISTDGINFKLAQLNNPKNSYGFLFKQDGHLIYVITFSDPKDGFSLAYDFNTDKFFNLSDDKGGIFPFRKVVFFNNKYYAISANDGNIYELDSELTSFDGKEIPRIRVCKNYKTQDSKPFIVNNLIFTMEQGQVNSHQYPKLDVYKGLIGLASDFPLRDIVQIGDFYNITTNVTDNDPDKTNTGQSFLSSSQIVWNGNAWSKINHTQSRVDISLSRDGGATFGGSVAMNMQPLGARKNRFIAWNMGLANDFCPQFRFWGLERFVATDGEIIVQKQE